MAQSATPSYRLSHLNAQPHRQDKSMFSVRHKPPARTGFVQQKDQVASMCYLSLNAAALTAKGERVSATLTHSGTRHERKILGPANSANGKVNVQAWPIEVIWCRTLNVADLRHRGLLKPREMLKGQQQRLVSKEHPETMRRDVGDFSRRSGVSMHLRFPSKDIFCRAQTTAQNRVRSIIDRSRLRAIYPYSLGDCAWRVAYLAKF
jgi:hypothetical protein